MEDHELDIAREAMTIGLPRKDKLKYIRKVSDGLRRLFPCDVYPECCEKASSYSAAWAHRYATSVSGVSGDDVIFECLRAICQKYIRAVELDAYEKAGKGNEEAVAASMKASHKARKDLMALCRS